MAKSVEDEFYALAWFGASCIKELLSFIILT